MMQMAFQLNEIRLATRLPVNIIKCGHSGRDNNKIVNINATVCVSSQASVCLSVAYEYLQRFSESESE